MLELVVGENSFVDIVDADEYFETKLYVDEWINADNETKMRALITATNNISNLQFKGIKTDIDQVLAFPRAITPDYIETEISNQVKQACCEEAIAILKQGNSQREQLRHEGVVSFSVGSLSETFAQGKIQNQNKLTSLTATKLLSIYNMGSVGII